MTTLRLLLSTTFAATLSLALGGCFYFPNTRDDEPVPAPAPYDDDTPTQVGQAEVFQGTLGNIGRFSKQSPELRISGGSTYGTVRIDAVDTTARWWAMTNLSFNGGLSHPALVPGAHLVFDGSRRSISGLSVSALGCSGPSRGNYTYDHEADSVVIDVLDGSRPDSRRMVFTSTYTHDSGRQVVQGSFEYDIR